MIQLMTNLRFGFSYLRYGNYFSSNSEEDIVNRLNLNNSQLIESDNQINDNEPIINRLPILVLEKIFCNLSDQDLKSCLLVCKHWNNVIENESKQFWKRQCIIDKKLTNEQADKLNNYCIRSDYKMIYYSNLFNKNFLKNPDGYQSMKYWCCAKSIDSRYFKDINKQRLQNIIEIYRYNYRIPDVRYWKVEDSIEFDRPNKLRHFSTLSNKIAEKMQVIDLKMQGKLIDSLIKKNLHLKLEIVEYYKITSRSQYNLYVFIVNNDYQLVDNCNFYCNVASGNHNANEFAINKWKVYRREFTIRCSIRYIIFYHSGESKFNGTMMTNGSVRFYV